MKTHLVITLAAVVLTAAVAPAHDRLGENLGTVNFESSGDAETREHVTRGVKLVHHMMYPEADREFSTALEQDSACGLAWWGRAMVLIHPLWPEVPTEAERQRGAEFLRRGLAIASLTPRERDYLQTLDVYFGDTTGQDYPRGLQALDKAWIRLSEKYPDDVDALAFSALFHLAPVRFQPKDGSHRPQIEAAGWLQEVLARLPDHPGGQHYKIHALDFPGLAGGALEVCDTYSATAPDVPHALHMPTHIYTRRGLWEKSIDFNTRSAQAAQRLAASTGEMNSHYPHALDYLAYAYLQTGQYQAAEQIRDRLPALTGPYGKVQRPAMAFAFAAIPARCALERQRWAVAADLPLHAPDAFPWGPAFLNCDSLVQFARALGAARSGRLDQARQEIRALEQKSAALHAATVPPYWKAQAEAQLLAARAWVRQAEGQPKEAIALMRQAAEIEATTDKEAVTPGEVLPAGELLGDLLLENQQPAEAMTAYEAVLAVSPNRFNSLAGAAQAAERSGDPAKAKAFCAQLLQVAARADPGNPRLEHARVYLAGKGVAVRQ